MISENSCSACGGRMVHRTPGRPSDGYVCAYADSGISAHSQPRPRRVDALPCPCCKSKTAQRVLSTDGVFELRSCSECRGRFQIGTPAFLKLRAEGLSFFAARNRLLAIRDEVLKEERKKA
jgi:hypothetical protein